MKINNEELRKIFKSYILENSSITSQACPPSEEIADLFSSPGCGKKKEHIIDHIVNCPFCLQEFDAFLQISRREKNLMEEIDIVFQKGGVKTSIFSKRKRGLAKVILSWRFALATTLSLFLVAVLVLRTSIFFSDKQPNKRSLHPKGIELIEPSPGQVAKKPLIFRWAEVEGRDYSILEIFDESLIPIWKSPKIFENIYHLPQKVEQKISPGRCYFWMITIYFPNGMKLESQLEELFVSN